MNKELAAYYEARFDMFASQGWRDLMEDVQAMRDANDTVSGLEDIRKLGVRQGEVSIMDWLLSLQQVSESAYEEMQREGSP